jgi:hypothetical protein
MTRPEKRDGVPGDHNTVHGGHESVRIRRGREPHVPDQHPAGRDRHRRDAVLQLRPARPADRRLDRHRQPPRPPPRRTRWWGATLPAPAPTGRRGDSTPSATAPPRRFTPPPPAPGRQPLGHRIMTRARRPRTAPACSATATLAVAAMTAALTAAADIIAALCLGLASLAGAASAALADALACAAVALAVAGYIAGYPACPRTTAAPRAPTRPTARERGTRLWEHDTLDEHDWTRWEREVLGPPAPGASPRTAPRRPATGQRQGHPVSAPAPIPR